MGRSQDLLERLKAADRSLAKERMPRTGARRVAKRVSAELDAMSRPSRLGWIPMLTFVAGAALVMLFLRWSTSDTTPVTSNEAEQAAMPATMAVHVTGAACRSESGRTTSVWGACSLSTTGPSSPSMRIDTIEASHLEVDGRVVHLRTGSALFDVEKVLGEPVRVAIPQGEIVVVGTRFRVIVGEGHSEVELYEGHLEFHDPSGQVTPIAAGQHVEFGAPPKVSTAGPVPVTVPQDPVASEPTDPPPSRPAPRPRARPRVAPQAPPQPQGDDGPLERDAGPVIEAAERLRREGRYSEAASTLRSALKRRWPTRTADVLSYELGRLLQRRVRDRVSACDHWREHLGRFEKTRYRTRIERAMKELRCE